MTHTHAHSIEDNKKEQDDTHFTDVQQNIQEIAWHTAASPKHAAQPKTKTVTKSHLNIHIAFNVHLAI